jgi:ComF family protein
MVFQTISKNAMGLFFPNLCIVCRNVLTYDKWLCGPCAETLRVNNARRDACPLCGQNRSLRLCACASVWKNPYEAVYSIFDFDETVQGIVHEIKYRGQKRLAMDMGKAYVNLVPPSFFEGMDTVVSVPLHFFRMMKRGYNQAEHLARGFVKGSAVPLQHLQHVLVRKRPTKTQTRLSRRARRQNVKGAFVVSPGKRNCIENKNIILVDDIVTTGATTGECASALIAAGCGKVRVLSLARD